MDEPELLPEGRKREELRTFRATVRWFLLSALVGLVAGLGAVAFYAVSHHLTEFFLGDVAGYHPVPPRGESGILKGSFDYEAPGIEPWLCVLLPAAGGLLAGLLMMRYAPEARGHGTDGAIEAYHRKGGIIRPAVIWVKAVASALTLGSGGSGGREGPIAQIGAGFGSWLGGRLRLSPRERRILLAAGMGAGVGAIFRAPLAGALFASEVLYRRADFDHEVMMPAIVSCITSYTVFSMPYGGGTLFATDLIDNAQHLVFSSPVELVPYGVLALVLVAMVFLYVRAFYGTERLFDRINLPRWLGPAAGGLLTGVVALALYLSTGDGRSLNVLAFGYGAIQEAFDYSNGATDAVPWVLVGMFLLVALGKIVTTSLTIGSGGSAGVFGPSMVIGGATGAAVGFFFHATWPDISPHPGAFAIVGMAGFFTGAAHVPISTLIMVSEVTGNYQLLLPVMWVEAITFSLCRNVSIYTAQVETRKESPAHRGDFIVDVLEGIRVGDMAEKWRAPVTVELSTPLREVIQIIEESRSHYFPVVDQEGRLVGIYSTNDIRRYLHDEPLWDLLVAADIMNLEVLTVTPEDTLSTALQRFTERNIDEIPVVDSEDPARVRAMLRRREVIAVYNRRLAELRAEPVSRTG